MKKKRDFKTKIEDFTYVINNIKVLIKNKDKNKLVSIIVSMLIILILVFFFKIPFILFRDLIKSILVELNITGVVLMNTLDIVFELMYVIFGIYMYINIVGDKTKDLLQK